MSSRYEARMAQLAAAYEARDAMKDYIEELEEKMSEAREDCWRIEDEVRWLKRELDKLQKEEE